MIHVNCMNNKANKLLVIYQITEVLVKFCELSMRTISLNFNSGAAGRWRLEN